MVHASRGRLPPASTELRSEPAIIAGMARATLPDSRVAWLDLIANYDSIRDKIETVFPDFHDFNARIRHPGGFRLPLGPTERIWRTASGKAEFLVFEGLAEDIALTDPSLMKLTTVRSHDQYNTTIYGLDDRYRGIFGRRDVVFMNPSDLEARGLAPGDLIARLARDLLSRSKRSGPARLFRSPQRHPLLQVDPRESHHGGSGNRRAIPLICGDIASKRRSWSALRCSVERDK
jgi:anaerobic selenocysteine-containing dehydrogenase